MPEFYIIIARKNIFHDFFLFLWRGGARAPYRLPSPCPTPMLMVDFHAIDPLSLWNLASLVFLGTDPSQPETRERHQGVPVSPAHRPTARSIDGKKSSGRREIAVLGLCRLVVCLSIYNVIGYRLGRGGGGGVYSTVTGGSRHRCVWGRSGCTVVAYSYHCRIHCAQFLIIIKNSVSVCSRVDVRWSDDSVNVLLHGRL